ncbi:MAG: amidase family protein [Pseudomonadota bacterium]
MVHTTYAVEEIKGLISQGHFSATDWTLKAIGRADRYRADNIFITLDRDGALSTAHAVDLRLAAGETPRPLEGVPFVVKDNIAASGLPFTGGSLALKLPVPDEDAPVVQSLKDAGAILLGKVNLHEYAFGATSNNAAFGPVLNPHDPTRSAGGSSGGSAAAIVRGIAPVALGTDTGGSGRIPASFCGCVGYRPSRPRYSTDGILQLTWTLDTAALFGTSVSDVITSDTAILGLEKSSQSFKGNRLKNRILGIPDDETLSAMESGVSDTFSKRLELLTDAGCQLKTVNFSQMCTMDQAAAFNVAMFEANAIWTAFLRETGTTAKELIAGIQSPDVANIFAGLLKSPVSRNAYFAAMQQVHALRHYIDDVFKRMVIDAICFPTVPIPPPLVSAKETFSVNGVDRPLFPTLVRHTSPGALAGLPGLSLPAGTLLSELPFGLEIDGLVGCDEDLFALALEIEAVMKGLP